MFAAMSRKKQMFKAAASAGVNGGTSRVLTSPASGAFAISPSAQTGVDIVASVMRQSRAFQPYCLITGAIMNHEAAVLKAREIASRVLAPAAAQNDTAGRFSTEAIRALGDSGLLGVMLPADVGGLGLGPRTFGEVTAALAEADASVAMVYVMHVMGTASIAAARPDAVGPLKTILQQIAAGRHLSTLAFSESGSRSRSEEHTS